MKSKLIIFKNGTALKGLAILLVLFLVLPIPFGPTFGTGNPASGEHAMAPMGFTAFLSYFVTILILCFPQIVLLWVLGVQQGKRFRRAVTESGDPESQDEEKL